MSRRSSFHVVAVQEDSDVGETYEETPPPSAYHLSPVVQSQ